LQNTALVRAEGGAAGFARFPDGAGVLHPRIPSGFSERSFSDEVSDYANVFSAQVMLAIRPRIAAGFIVPCDRRRPPGHAGKNPDQRIDSKALSEIYTTDN
jgi:hypothetical protein